MQRAHSPVTSFDGQRVAAKAEQHERREDPDRLHAVLRMLAPAVDAFTLFNRRGEPTWRSDDASDHELDECIAGLPGRLLRGQGDSHGREFGLPSGRLAIVLPLPAKQQGVLAAVVGKDTAAADDFSTAAVTRALTPAIALMAERLTFRDRLALVSAELELIYEVDEQIHGLARSHAGLARLVGQSGRFLEIGYSVLLIPGKRIRISATHSSWKNANRRVIDRYLVDHLMPRLQGRRQPVIYEIPPMDEGPATGKRSGHQTLLTPILDRAGRVEGLLAQLGRVNNHPFLEEHRRFMAHIGRKVQFVIDKSYDGMTGLMNRTGLEAQFRESHRALQASNDVHQLIYIDIDNLKLVNDKFGITAGDEVVTRIAALLAEDLPNSAVLSRLEGDEFCILLTHASCDDALALAEAASKRMHKLRYLQGDESLQLSVSIGIAEFNADNALTGEALTTARMACDGAKSRGRDRVHVYDEENQSMIRRHDDMNLVAEIQRALDNDSFYLMAQPIMSLASPEDCIRYELLLRLEDSQGERIPTEAFLSTAERYRMMPQIDRWVVENTLALIRQNIAILDGRSVHFSMNLSGQSLADDDMLEFITESCRSSSVPLELVGFEITESAAISNMKNAQAFIAGLHDMGCRISLDDFGTGLSSFAYLKNFAVDTLKIDGSFVHDITTNRISESMVAAITQVAKVMELETVAEYVASEEILAKIRELGVDYAQGHLVGAARPLAEALDTLSDLGRSWLD